MAIKFSTEKANEIIQRDLYRSLVNHCDYLGGLPKRDTNGRESAIEVYRDDDDYIVAEVIDKRVPFEGRLVSGIIIGPQESDMAKMLSLEKYVVRE